MDVHLHATASVGYVGGPYKTRQPAPLHTSEFRSCVKVEVTVLGAPSLIVLDMVSVDVKQH